MARFGVSITKRTAFRLAQQEFSNTYYYEGPSLPNNAEANTIIDDIVVTEKKLHSTQVTFVQGRLWSHGLGAVNNRMIADKSLSGTGNNAAAGGLDRERALLVQWPAGFDVRGRPVTLKKWYHLCGTYPGGTVPSTGDLEGTAQILAAVRTAVANIADEVLGQPGATSTYSLCSPTGRLTTGQAVTNPWLEHHQLGDAWRG
jgi:hypothetical protein